MKIKIEAFDSFKYLELWEIIPGQIDPIPLRKYVPVDWVNPDPKKYRTSSISTTVTGPASRGGYKIELDLFE